MSKKNESVAVEAKWKIDSPIINKANAFRSVYTPESITLYIGLIDPEILLPGFRKTGKIAEIQTLARYCLDKDDLIRLKNEIDKTIDGLKKRGVVFKDVK